MQVRREEEEEPPQAGPGREEDAGTQRGVGGGGATGLLGGVVSQHSTHQPHTPLRQLNLQPLLSRIPRGEENCTPTWHQSNSSHIFTIIRMMVINR